MAVNPEDTDGNDDGWRFSLEDIEERDGSDQEDDEEGGNVAGSFSPADEIESGDIDLENALFVLFGVAIAVAGFAGFVNILP
ncbi:MAG: hypothetical protein V5A39_04460 [Haloarculaceae archaeon]